VQNETYQSDYAVCLNSNRTYLASDCPFDSKLQAAVDVG
jgi:hypothetical protein